MGVFVVHDEMLLSINDGAVTDSPSRWSVGSERMSSL
jgi:hypothetical protein